MKKLLILLFILNTVQISNAQATQSKVFPMTEGKVIYSNVITVDSVSKDNLYIIARQWLVDNFKSSKAVIQVDDKEAGVIIGNYTFIVSKQESLFSSYSFIVSQTITLKFKDNRCKYEISNFSIKSPFTFQYSSNEPINLEFFRLTGSNERNYEFYLKTHEKVCEIILSLKSTMNTRADELW